MQFQIFNIQNGILFKIPASGLFDIVKSIDTGKQCCTQFVMKLMFVTPTLPESLHK